MYKKIKTIFRKKYLSFLTKNFNYNILTMLLYGRLAQLVEQLTLNQWVQGSSPWSSTKKICSVEKSILHFLLCGPTD